MPNPVSADPMSNLVFFNSCFVSCPANLAYPVSNLVFFIFWLEVAHTLPEGCPNIIPKLTQSCLKVVRKAVRKLSESCPEMCPAGAQRLSKSCPNLVQKSSKSCPKARWHKHRNGHGSGPRESCGALDRCILHRILVRTTLWQQHFLDRGREIDHRGETRA